MFCVHGLVSNKYIPLVLFPLPSKQKTSYTLALNYRMHESRKLGIIFEPTTVVTDFKEVVLKDVSKNTKIVECKFHLGQSW